MSDSHAIPRATARARVRKAKPPKRPWRSSPPLLPALLGCAAAVGFYIWAIRHGWWLGVVAGALSTAVSLDEAVLWQRWRQWSAWSGEPIRWQPTWATAMDWCLNGFFFAAAAMLWLAEWIQP